MTNTKTDREQPDHDNRKNMARNVPLRTAIKAGADDADSNKESERAWKFRHSFGYPSEG